MKSTQHAPMIGNCRPHSSICGLSVSAVLVAATSALLAANASAQSSSSAPPDTPAPMSRAALDRATDKTWLPSLGSADDFVPRTPPKDYLLPALEIIGFDTLLNRMNHTFIKDTTDYDVSVRTWRRNLHSSWVTDRDPFNVNQFLHPYQGSIYHGFARSAGMDYWQSLGYTFAGSAFWEVFGEQTLPSRNDQIASGIAGTFLGESLFRMAGLVLEKETQLSPFWRETGAAAISPSTGFNRLVFGKRFDAIFNSHSPAYYGRLQLGVNGTAQNAPGLSTSLKRNEFQANFGIDYGLPGKAGYQYTRPFDYFNFEANASSANGVEAIFDRGLLIGRAYEVGDNYRGIWGLYGSYDYISPQIFRVSTTALSLGTTAQWWLSKTVALQGTGTTGIGYAAAETAHNTGDREYNYGLAPQALLSLRLILDEKAALGVNARQYYVSRVAAAETGGHENISRADVTLTYRVFQQHAVALKYQWSRRDAFFPRSGDQTQTRGTVGIYYTLLGKDGFGTVDWR